MVEKQGLVADKGPQTRFNLSKLNWLMRMKRMTLSLLIKVLTGHLKRELVASWRRGGRPNMLQMWEEPWYVLLRSWRVWGIRAVELKPSRLLFYKVRSWVLSPGPIFSLSYGSRVGSSKKERRIKWVIVEVVELGCKRNLKRPVCLVFVSPDYYYCYYLRSSSLRITDKLIFRTFAL